MSPFRRVRHGALPVIAIARSRRRRVLRLYRELAEECGRGAPESPELAPLRKSDIAAMAKARYPGDLIEDLLELLAAWGACP